MKLYLGLLESSAPDQTRIFGEIDGKLIDLNLACAAYLTQAQNNTASARELAVYDFRQIIADYLARGEAARKSLDEVVSFVQRSGMHELRGRASERIAYDVKRIRGLPPFVNPEKSFVIGFSDRARTEATPQSVIPTGVYKLPQPFISCAVVRPRFSEAVEAEVENLGQL